jgi:hypothetical protein
MESRLVHCKCGALLLDVLLVYWNLSLLAEFGRLSLCVGGSDYDLLVRQCLASLYSTCFRAWQMFLLPPVLAGPGEDISANSGTLRCFSKSN